MKPSSFEYERPTTLAGAVKLIQQANGAGKVLAGGQSLGPMLNLRLVQPELLVDVTAIPELKRIEKTTDFLVIGACVTHSDIEDGSLPGFARGLANVAACIAYRAVRNRGTIGGSLAHADPSADWLSCLSALDAEVLIYGPNGRRLVAVADFVQSAFEPALDADEILEAVRVPRLPEIATLGFYKVCRKTGEFAHAIGAVMHDPSRSVLRVVVGATHSRPLILTSTQVEMRSGEGGRPEMEWGAVMKALNQAGMTDPIDNKIRLTALRRAMDSARSLA